MHIINHLNLHKYCWLMKNSHVLCITSKWCFKTGGSAANCVRTGGKERESTGTDNTNDQVQAKMSFWIRKIRFKMRPRKRCTEFNWIQNKRTIIINQVFFSCYLIFWHGLPSPVTFFVFSPALASPSMSPHISYQLKLVPQTRMCVATGARWRHWHKHIYATDHHWGFAQRWQKSPWCNRHWSITCHFSGFSQAHYWSRWNKVQVWPIKHQVPVPLAFLTRAILQYWTAGLSQQCDEE